MSEANGDAAAVDGPNGNLWSDATLGAEQVRFPAGAVLFEPGSPPRHVYRIEGGQVRIHQVGPDDSARLVEILGPGDWSGLGALANPPAYICRGRAVTDTLALRVPVDRLREASLRQPALALELIEHLARKLQAAQDAAGRLVFDDCNGRLIKTLLHFSQTAAAVRDGDDGAIELRITHQQLAQAVGAARETVSLALTQLRQRNLLRTGRNRLFFRPDALRALCNAPST